MRLLKRVVKMIIPPRMIPYVLYLRNGRRPRLAILDISAVCNAQCPFCPRVFMPEGRKKGFMTMELFEKCLTEIKGQGIRDVRLYATSEPTLHPVLERS